MTGTNDNSRNGKRLDTWKEIGGFFGRDERTVKRWEMTRKLPVHRVPGGGRANVYAYEGELAEWLRGNDAQAEAERDEAAQDTSGKAGAEESGSVEVAGATVDGADSGAGEAEENRSWGKSALILSAVVAVAVLAGLLIYKIRAIGLRLAE